MIDLSTIDYHTAGEPFRIVLDGAPEIAGSTVRERRERALDDEKLQEIRRLLCSEPRGHADMYGGLLVPPDDDGAETGVLFWHKDGFSIACGHGSIALGIWAVEQGRVAADPDGVTEIGIDVPSGRVMVRVRCEAGVPQSVTFRNVPSYVLARDVAVQLGSREFSVDVAYGGAIYASVPAAALGLSVRPEHLTELITSGRAIKQSLSDRDIARHPIDDRLSGVYGVVLYEDLGQADGGLHHRNVTVFADGEVDRSPCGSGTSARLALLAGEGHLAAEQELLHESIIGTEFRARIAGSVEVDGRTAIITDVEGMAYKTGHHVFSLDERDPLGTGFVLR